jgi:hypothetical protein
MADTQVSPQDHLVWLYSRKARDACASMAAELARALERVEALEARVQALEIAMLDRRSG